MREGEGRGFLLEEERRVKRRKQGIEKGLEEGGRKSRGGRREERGGWKSEI